MTLSLAEQAARRIEDAADRLGYEWSRPKVRGVVVTFTRDRYPAYTERVEIVPNAPSPGAVRTALALTRGGSRSRVIEVTKVDAYIADMNDIAAAADVAEWAS